MNAELQQYIKPGEFTFCGRCGRIVRYGNQEFICTSCQNDLFSRTLTPLERQEIKLKIEYEIAISEMIITHRLELAELRKCQRNLNVN